MAAGNPDAATFLEKVEQLVFVPTSREEQVARRNVQHQGWKHSFAEGGQRSTLGWQFGCIQEVIPGGDEVIRVAMVRTATGLIKRAVAKLAVLPIDSEIVGTYPFPTGGACAHRCSTAPAALFAYLLSSSFFYLKLIYIYMLIPKAVA